MAEYRKEIAGGAAIAVLLAATLGFVAVYSFPSATTITLHPNPTISTETGVVTTTTAAGSTFLGSTSIHRSTSLTNSTNGVWEVGSVVSLVLNSPEVQASIAGAYSYEVGNVYPSQADPDLLNVVVNATQMQAVTGNLTSGYEVSYTGLKSLSAEVRFTQPSTYTLVSVKVVDLPNTHESITYDPVQQQVVHAALSNSTVKMLMGGGAFYPEWVSPVAIPNGTYAGDFSINFYQLNGTGDVGALVNGASTSVVSSYASSRIETMCFTLGTPPGVPASENEVCFTSPWTPVTTTTTTTTVVTTVSVSARST